MGWAMIRGGLCLVFINPYFALCTKSSGKLYQNYVPTPVEGRTVSCVFFSLSIRLIIAALLSCFLSVVTRTRGHIAGIPPLYGSTIFTLIQGDINIQPRMVSPEIVFNSPSRILLCFKCACPYRGSTRTAKEKDPLPTCAMGVFGGLRFPCLSQSMAFRLE